MVPTEAPKKTRLAEFKCENGYICVLLVHPQMLLDFGFWRFINTPEISGVPKNHHMRAEVLSLRPAVIC